MKKAISRTNQDLRPEYKRSDFGRLVRGKYAAEASRRTNVVLLDPEVAEAFPDDAAVNRALRCLMTEPETASRPSQSATGSHRKRRIG